MEGSAFISYSREDSDFALRLAQDLKTAGASIWLDQLDIEPGNSWDNAIEEALDAATHILIVLSPASAHSANVRNEISYALEQGKVIIPVLYTECVVPLQLQRNQRIDFRNDYAHGLTSLLTHLHVTNPDSSVIQKAAVADAHRQTAWQARDAQNTKIAERQQDNPPSQAALAAQALLDPVQLGASSDPSRSPRKLQWKQYAIPIFLLPFVIAAIVSFGLWLHADKSPSGLYKRAVEATARKEFTDAAGLYDQACNLHDAKSCIALASFYTTGTGVPVKPLYVLTLFDKACDLGDFSACSNLGMRYYTGDGTKKQPDLAVVYNQKACDGGNAAGCSNLAILYNRGDGVDKDPAKALTLFQKACDGNDSIGCSALGKHYADGNGVPKDMKKAAAFDKKACDAGRASSCARLGDLYNSGDGVEQDLSTAKELYQKGCLLGDEKACDAWHGTTPKP